MEKQRCFIAGSFDFLSLENEPAKKKKKLTLLPLLDKRET
jgi:hypothetical protein